jgi:hypothetical protein
LQIKGGPELSLSAASTNNRRQTTIPPPNLTAALPGKQKYRLKGGISKSVPSTKRNPIVKPRAHQYTTHMHTKYRKTPPPLQTPPQTQTEPKKRTSKQTKQLLVEKYAKSIYYKMGNTTQ